MCILLVVPKDHTSCSAEWTVPFNNSITHANDSAKLIHLHLVCRSIITLLQPGDGRKLEILITALHFNPCYYLQM